MSSSCRLETSLGQRVPIDAIRPLFQLDLSNFAALSFDVSADGQCFAVRITGPHKKVPGPPYSRAKLVFVVTDPLLLTGPAPLA